jgi:hypothetical protein
MKVLVACEESQEVCKAFRAKGHEAYSCDIIDPSGGHPEWHINLPGWIKYYWLKSNHKLEYTLALLANAKRIYKVRNKYVDGIKQRHA